jgi:putative heme iron utilization protein
MMVPILLVGLILIVSCGIFSSSFPLVGQTPRIIPYYYRATRTMRATTALALPMAPLDDKAREEAVAKYIAKANEETMQTLKRLEQEKDDEIRALKQRLADILKAKSTPPIDATTMRNNVDSSTASSLRQEIELQALRLEVEALKQHVAAISLQRVAPPPLVAFSNDYLSYNSEEVEVLRLRLAALQNSILLNNANNVLPANLDFSPPGTRRDNTADELTSLRLRLARLQDELFKRLGPSEQQQQQQPNAEKQSKTDIQTIRAQLDSLLQKVFGRGNSGS